jgi:formamidopyrimidine-DNA glycosylase
MPELPEVEVTRRGLLKDLPGCRIDKITWSGKRLRKPMPEKLLVHHIEKNLVQTIDRRAKFLLFRMTNGSTLVMHLGMTGKISLVSANEPPARHDHLRLLLDSGMEMRFNDARRFGSIVVWSPAESARLEKTFSRNIGVEPLSDAFHAGYLQEQSRKRRQPVKNFLMDARRVAGIGNIYANEILFDAGVHPRTPVNRISRHTWRKITAATGATLNAAILSGGSTISDFLGTGGNPGYFQLNFKVYGRGGKKCRQCPETIRKTVISGRASYFCPHCQKKTGAP